MEPVATMGWRASRTPVSPISANQKRLSRADEELELSKCTVDSHKLQINKPRDEKPREQARTSATLDSGIRSWDHLLNGSGSSNGMKMVNMCNRNDPEKTELVERDKQATSKQQRSKSFSLKRSLSFRAKRTADRWPIDEPISSNNNKDDQQQQYGLQEATSVRPQANLLFRSRSLRLGDRSAAHFSSHCDQTNYRKTATIDYLASAAHTKRHSAGCRKEEFIPRKIIMFLRKLFTSRNRAAVVGASACENAVQLHPQAAPTCNIFLSAPSGELDRSDHLAAIGTATSGQEARLSAPAASPSRHCWSRQSAGTTNTTGSDKFHPLIRSKSHRSARSPGDHSSASSESASSLIEILDCSRRQLHQKSLSVKRNRAATWQLINRSDSSLSHASDASCSTTRSTASQQLRRHLDEAYRRNRKCTSKRERDFLDSINVLRQASRHALQSPGWGARSRAKSAASSAGEQDSGCHCHSWQPDPETTNHGSTGGTLHSQLSPEWIGEMNGAAGGQESSSGWPTHSQLPVSQHQQVQPLAQHPPTPACSGWMPPSDCCLCTMYLTSNAGAHLTCPYTYCTAMAGLGGPSCCLSEHQKSPQQPPLAPGRLLDLQSCCPIWRSMLHGYQQHQQPPQPQQQPLQSPQSPPPPPPAQANYHLDSASGVIQSLESLEKLVTSQQVLHQHQQQQQHHNTTIDLKIEIAGDFSSSSISGSGGEDEKEWTGESLDSGGDLNTDKAVEIDSMDEMARMPLPHQRRQVRPRRATYYADH